MQLKVEVLTRDLISREITKREAVRTDYYDTQTGQPIVTDSIEIERITWDRNGTILVKYSLGTYIDSEYRKDASYSDVSYKFSRTETPKLWEEFKLDSGITVDIAKTLLLREKPALNVVARSHWKLPELSAELIDEQKPVTEAPIVEERK